MTTNRIDPTFKRQLIRSLAYVFILAGLAIGFLGCPASSSQPQEQPKPGSPIPPLSEAEQRRRSDRIRGYFRERATQKAIVATTRTKSGQIIDWIRPESQLPPDQKLATAPMLARNRTPIGYTAKISRFEKPPAGVDRLAKTEVQAQPEARGPKVHGMASAMSVAHTYVLTGPAVLASLMRNVGPSWAHLDATSSGVSLVPGVATHHNL